MDFLPQASRTRPRLACEILPRGVVAARASSASAPVGAVARVDVAEGAIAPGLKAGNVVDRVAVVSALRRALEAVGGKPNARGADVTLIVPDGAVRVLLLDFDALPNKLTEALPLVKFRLKKLIPFDADEAMVTFQVMSSAKSGVRVLAVAVPRDVLGEYESVVREAGFEPGAVLPSTLAALAAVSETGASLVVNANPLGVTTAIVREGIVLLHLSVDLQASHLPDIPALTGEPDDAMSVPVPVARGESAYADHAVDEAAVQGIDGITGMASAPAYATGETYRPVDHAPAATSAVASSLLLAELNAEQHNSILLAPTSLGTLTEDRSGREVVALTAAALAGHFPSADEAVAVHPLSADAAGEEIAQAVSKGAAYFEDTLSGAPSTLWSAGPLGAERLKAILASHGLTEADGLTVRELIGTDSLAADASSGNVPRGWMSGVVGALKG